MNLLRTIIIIWFILQSSFLAAQPVDNHPERRQLRAMFYNVENLFDIYDDPAANDDEFTPAGSKKWTMSRYRKKLNDLAKVIIAVGEWEVPDIIGLCEVENFQVLADLISNTPLKAYPLRIIHENSPDSRGIDVALLFKPDKLTLISHVALPVGDSKKWQSRDILLTSLLYQQDTLHLFVNHWPSRFGGKDQTESRRKHASARLRLAVDSLIRENPNCQILIMGDFNDEPNDASIANVLSARQPQGIVENNKIYNLSYREFKKGQGTIFYKEISPAWQMFDQIIVSGTLLDKNGLFVNPGGSTVFIPPWLLKNGRPFRTYQGPIYKGGFSDHLPIFIDLYYNNNPENP